MPMFSDDGRFDPAAMDVLRRSWIDLGTLKTVPPDSALFTEQFLTVK